MAVVETLLFLWLTPGMVLTLPPIGGDWFCTETTSWQAVLTHAALFATILVLLKHKRLVEGFQEASQGQSEPEQKPRVASSNKKRIEERLAEKQYFGVL